jgi:two-component system, response regulator PdtaR
MSELNQRQMHSLECLRLEADCRELANSVRSPDLRSQLLRMAQTWSDLAVSGPSAPSGDGTSETEKQATLINSTRTGRAILIVEDHELLRQFMAGLMESVGFEAVQARNADEALTILESRSDVALLVTNVVMEGSMDGVELAHAVDIRWPSIKIIVVSGKRGLMESDLPRKCLLLAKPYHDDELVFEVRALIDA